MVVLYMMWPYLKINKNRIFFYYTGFLVRDLTKCYLRIRKTYDRHGTRDKQLSHSSQSRTFLLKRLDWESIGLKSRDRKYFYNGCSCYLYLTLKGADLLVREFGDKVSYFYLILRNYSIYFS